MAFRLQHTSHTTKLVIVAELLLLSYLLYTLTTSVYRSYQIDLHIKKFEEDVARIEEENRQKIEEFEYYSSDAYKEKIAKQNLGLVNQGEEVIIVPNEILETSGSGANNDGEEEKGEALSNPQRWWKLFFGSKDPEL